MARVATSPPPELGHELGEQEMQRRAAAHELHGLEQLAQRPARDHDRQRLVAVHDAVAEVREQAAGCHGTGGGDARAVGQRRGRKHAARVGRSNRLGCARAPRRRVAPRRPRMRKCAGSRASSAPRPAWRSPTARPRSRSIRTWDLDAAAATLARTEELGGAADEHGRFPASASALAAGAAPLDEIVLALREAAEAAGVEPAPDYPGDARFAVALTHDIDTPWRWSRRGLLGAAARLKSALVGGDSEAMRVEAAGLALAPLHRLRGSDPNWSHERFAASEQRHGFRSTCFVLAAHRDPHDGAAPGAYAARRARLVRELDGLGLEVGLHASYTCLADERLAGRRARRALEPARRADRRQPPPLPAPAVARGHPRARPPRLRLRHDARLRRADRTAGRPLVPVPAVGRRHGRARCASSSCRSC